MSWFRSPSVTPNDQGKRRAACPASSRTTTAVESTLNSEPVVPHQGLTGVRLLVNVAGTLYKLARIRWSTADASVYVMPYVPKGGIGFAGPMKVPAPEASSSVNFARELMGPNPKLSLHESGRCHGSVGEQRTGPVWGRGLFDGSGHIATITSFDVTSQPTVAVTRTGTEPDIILMTPGFEVPGMNVALLVGDSPEEAGRLGQLHFILDRPDRPRPLYVALNCRDPGQSAEGPPVPGVTVIAGWGPGSRGDQRPLSGTFVATAPGPGAGTTG